MQNARVSSAKKTTAAKKATGTSKGPATSASTKAAATKAKAPTSKAVPTKDATRKPAPTTTKPALSVEKATAAKPAIDPKKPGPRADFGAPIDAFFGRQPDALKPLLIELRRLVEEAAPEATSSLKWGMPCYSIGDTMMCLLGGHKAHVNLVLSGPPGTYADPRGLLEGDGKTGRRIKLTSLADMPVADVKRWLRAAAAHARGH
jgi:hypothetical protein